MNKHKRSSSEYANELNEISRNMLKKPHFIFSTENPKYPQKKQMSHEEAVNQIKQRGLEVEDIFGKYDGKKEKSLFVKNPTEEHLDYLHEMASDLGQESAIYSTGEEHEMPFYHGDKKGYRFKGSGTNVYDKEPEDYYSTTKDGKHFAHNIDFNKLHKNKYRLKSLKKTLTAGSSMGAPSTLTGGAALQRESLDKKLVKAKKDKRTYRGFDNWTTSKLREVINHPHHQGIDGADYGGHVDEMKNALYDRENREATKKFRLAPKKSIGFKPKVEEKDEEYFLDDLFGKSELKKGGKKANIGETRTWSGKKYTKTNEGWVYTPSSDKSPSQTTTSTAKTPQQSTSIQQQPTSQKEEKPSVENKTEVVTKPQTPREELKQSEEEKQAEFVNARKSIVENIGEDIKGAARHKRGFNSIKELSESSESNFKLKDLLKQFPINLVDDVTSKNAMNPYIAQRILERFPTTYKHEVQREKYLDFFEFVRNRVQELSKDNELNFTDVIKTIRNELASKIKENRSSKDYVRGSDDFIVGYVNNTLGLIPKRGNVAQDATDLVDAFKSKLEPISGESRNEANQRAYASMVTDEGISNIKSMIEGEPISKVFEIEKESSSRGKKLSLTEIYTSKAVRKGPDTGLETKEEQVSFLTKGCEIRGIQWGNSVTDKEREHHLKMASESFKDLADITGLPDKMISYNGRLGLAFGARGSGRALAHYESKEVAINLTRAKGVGSLAHEWGHFLDNILAKTHNSNAHENNMFLSEISHFNLKGEDSEVKKAMVDLVKSDVWKGFVDSSKTALKELQENMGITEKPSYWLSPRELFARAFEGYVTHKLEKDKRENTYLSGGSAGLMWTTNEQREEMAPYFDKFFKALKDSDHIKKALNMDKSIKNIGVALGATGLLANVARQPVQENYSRELQSVSSEKRDEPRKANPSLKHLPEPKAENIYSVIQRNKHMVDSKYHSKPSFYHSYKQNPDRWKEFYLYVLTKENKEGKESIINRWNNPSIRQEEDE